MRIAITTLGTRGDVQPYVALARALSARGHDVQLAAPEQFAGLAAQWNVAFAPLPGEFLALLDTPEGKAAVGGGQGFSAGFKLLKHVRPLMRRLIDLEYEATRSFGAQALVYHPKSIAAPHAAEALQIPAILASPLPGFTPTAAFPSPMLPFASLGPLNRISHALAINGAEMLFGKTIADWRESALGLDRKPRRRLAPTGTLYAYSKHVLPVPADWGEDVLVSGYWFLDDPNWQMPEDLAAFLAAGDKPVYVGFGSMPGLDPDRTATLIAEALLRTGKRGLLATGGGAIGETSRTSQLHAVAGAPHDRLLPLVHGAIHHGGAGTTGAALRAGVPMAIMPFFGDQPFWARRMQQLGAAPPQIDRKTLTVDGLAAAFVALDQPAMRANASRVGAAIRGEDGVAAACAFIEARAGAA